jgi:hypothetical protein
MEVGRRGGRRRRSRNRIPSFFGDEGEAIFAQHEAADTEREKVIDGILKSPEFHRQFVERATKDPRSKATVCVPIRENIGERRSTAFPLKP